MFRKAFLMLLLPLVVAPTVYAEDSDRITQLEQEVLQLNTRLGLFEDLLEGELQDLNQRVTYLESQLNKTGKKFSLRSGSKAHSNWLSHWRGLVVGMSPDEVRELLGEPVRVQGGELSHWYYPKEGAVTFLAGQVRSWTEPYR